MRVLYQKPAFGTNAYCVCPKSDDWSITAFRGIVLCDYSFFYTRNSKRSFVESSFLRYTLSITALPLGVAHDKN